MKRVGLGLIVALAGALRAWGGRPPVGIKVVVDKKSEFFMGGTMLDFNDGLLDRGFVFKNPQATGSCGCGTSFTPAA
mgnify:CR=1 FL=1